jgi:phage portal protein BeeE
MVNAPNMASSLTYSNVESASLDLVRYTLAGYRDTIADYMSELLPGDYLTGRQVRLSLKALTQGEQLSRYTAYESALRAGWMTIDEVRLAEGMAPQETAEPSQAPTAGAVPI